METLTAFFDSWQAQTLFGLIILDVGLGIACALRMGDFAWSRLGEFYRTMVLPYLLGYLVLWVAVGHIIPPAAGLPWLNEGLVTLAWVTIVTRLGDSILINIQFIYRPEIDEAG